MDDTFLVTRVVTINCALPHIVAAYLVISSVNTSDL